MDAEHRVRAVDLGVVAAVLASFGGWLWAGAQPSGCHGLQYRAAFAGSPERFDEWASTSCRIDSGGATGWLLLAAALSVVFAVAGTVALRSWWPKFGSEFTIKARSLAWLPAVAALFDVLQRAVVALGLEYHDDTVSMRGFFAWLAPGFAWPKAIGVAAACFLLAVTAAWKLIRRPIYSNLTFVGEPPVWENGDIEGLGICCSGGGIRAGAIALGVLDVLERTNMSFGEVQAAEPSLLCSAKYVASVSGGGYTSGAWFNATGSPRGIKTDGGPSDAEAYEVPRVIGDLDGEAPPRNYDDPKQLRAGRSLYHHIEARQQFLRTGNGGMAGSVVQAVASFVWHLFVIIVALVLVAWPAGRVARSWYVFGTSSTPVKEILDTEHMQYHPQWAQFAPLVIFGGLALLVFVLSLRMRRTTLRQRTRLLALVLASVALSTAAYVIVFPWLLDVVYPVLRKGPSYAAVVLTGLTGVSAIAYHALAKVASKRLILVSGYLVMLAGAAVAILIAGNAAANEQPFALQNHWVTEHTAVHVDVKIYLLSLVVALTVGAQLQPRGWSLHTLYRRRVRDAFATTVVRQQGVGEARRDRDLDELAAPASKVSRVTQACKVAIKGAVGAVVDPGKKAVGSTAMAPQQPGTIKKVWPVHRRYERALSAASLTDASGAARTGTEQPGPKHLVCCAAARRDVTGTGIKAESFVFSADHVTLYVSEEGGNTRYRRVATSDYETAVPVGLRGESMVDALSGAAVAPAMGKMTRGTFGTFLAVTNIRLGVWMPNPAWITEGAGAAGPADPSNPNRGAKRARFPKAGVVSLAKEIAGLWSIDDEYLYITDGGHWDNLGLVELLRRRCRTIICVDAAGDQPGSFATLRQAVQLAALHAGAKVRAKDVPTPVVDTTVVPDGCFMLIGVDYEDDGEGTIVYLPARMWAAASRELAAFAAEDPKFPSYSTGNQLLSLRQFRYLVTLGQEIATTALRDDAVRQAVTSAIA